MADPGQDSILVLGTFGLDDNFADRAEIVAVSAIIFPPPANVRVPHVFWGIVRYDVRHSCPLFVIREITEGFISSQ